jgi:hypothetical protein
MRVDLRGGNIGVAEHFLDDTQVRAIPEQMRRETVPKQVRVNVRFQSRMTSMLFYDLPNAHGR